MKISQSRGLDSDCCFFRWNQRHDGGLNNAAAERYWIIPWKRYNPFSHWVCNCANWSIEYLYAMIPNTACAIVIQNATLDPRYSPLNKSKIMTMRMLIPMKNPTYRMEPFRNARNTIFAMPSDRDKARPATESRTIGGGGFLLVKMLSWPESALGVSYGFMLYFAKWFYSHACPCSGTNRPPG